MHNIFALSAWRVKFYVMWSQLLMTPCAMRNTPGMGEGDRRDRLEQAGNWLRAQRLARGFKTAGELARALSVDPSRISNYERGMSEVPRERAQQIADLFDMDIIEVRRSLGKWVPDDQASTLPEQTDPPPFALWDAAEEHLWRTPLLSRSRRAELIRILRALNAVPEEEPESGQERKGA